MRLANMGVSIALMAVSILLMLTIPSISNFILAIYATCGGLLICCLETQLKFLRVMIAVNFGFLFNSVWRFLFYLLLGSVALAYGNLFGLIVAIALFAMAVINTFILCRYPSYRQMREKIAEEEDRRIEARISKEVKAQAVNQLRK
ncbi:COPI associated protein [Fragilaria crotonensis]|nr:COPI associated protein [Fragilaria crotonensis]